MMLEDRKTLFELLLGDISMLGPHDEARRVLEEHTATTLNAIEPAIDALIKAGIKEGIRRYATYYWLGGAKSLTTMLQEVDEQPLGNYRNTTPTED